VQTAANTTNVDDPDTWPAPVLAWAISNAERLRGSTQFTGDLAVPLEGEDGFRELAGKGLMAYHCSRLLDHEVASVRENGLRMLSQDLVEERITEAETRGCISAAVAARLRTRNVYARGQHAHRHGQVCFVLGRNIFDQPNNGALPLLSAWGGEGLNGGPLDPTEHPVLGTPTIVVARIDLSVSHKISPCWPELGKVFVASLLGLEDRSADVFVRSSVSPGDVLDAWQPGHPEYDKHVSLPTA
jgi:hypothetical protein